MLVYSFLDKGQYSGVTWRFSTEAWQGVFLTRDIFDGTLGWADAHLTIFWRSVKLSALDDAAELRHRLPDRLVHRHPSAAPRAPGLAVS